MFIALYISSWYSLKLIMNLNPVITISNIYCYQLRVHHNNYIRIQGNRFTRHCGWNCGYKCPLYRGYSVSLATTMQYCIILIIGNNIFRELHKLLREWTSTQCSLFLQNGVSYVTRPNPTYKILVQRVLIMWFNDYIF